VRVGTFEPMRHRRPWVEIMHRADVYLARYRRLEAARDAGLPALTVARARRFLADYPDFWPVLVFLGEALTAMVDYEAGLKALESALAHCPPESRRLPLVQIGHHHKSRGDYAQAASWYRCSIESAPDHASGYIYLGGALARQGRPDEAEGAYREATGCLRGCIDEAYLNLGFVLRAQERLVEAAECFAHALELDPDYKEARRALRDVRAAIAYDRRTGRTDAD
jgi:tetratricopeptide (TPR) repeat protein